MIKQNGIAVKTSPGRGRGVYALKLFIPGDMIEVCPVMRFENEKWGEVAKSNIRNYAFGFDDKSTVIALGYGSLYNHSYYPNAYYKKGIGDSLEFVALKRITPHQEIFINYNGDPKDKSELWFNTI